MAINQLSFVPKRAEPQKQEKQKLSDIEKILQGLQVVQAGFGIASDFSKIGNAMQQSKINDQTIRLNEERIGAAQDQRAGILTPDQVIGKKVTPAQGPEIGAVGLRTPGGGVEYVKVEEQLSPYQQAQLDISRDTLAVNKQKAATMAAADAKNKKMDTEDKMRVQYDRASKDTIETLQAYKKIQSAATNPTPASDVSLVVGFMKMIDPGSVVREGEFATAEQTAGVPDRIRNTYNKILEGARLTPDQRTNFVAEARKIMNGQLQIQQKTDARYLNMAEMRGLDPDFILDSRFQKLGEKIVSEGGVGQVSQGNGQIQPTYEVLPSVTPEAKASPGAAGLNSQNDFYNNYLQKLQSR